MVIRMEKGQIQIEKCLKDHIKDYEFKMLLPVETIKTFLDTLSSVISCSISLTERHGEIIYTNKITSNCRIEVEENPGLKIQIEGRTIAHFYYEINNNDEKKTEVANIVITEYVEQLKILATIQYQKKEWEKYAETLEDIIQRERKRNSLAEKEDE